MNLSSIIIYARPHEQESLRTRLASLPGVEVHAAAPDGRLVATIECDDDAANARTYQAIERSEGVLSVALVYQYGEPDAAGGDE